MKKITALLAIVFIASSLFAQNEKESFKPSGKAFIRVFTNFNTVLSDGKLKSSAFALDRAYLGYEYNLSENFSGKVNFDIGNPGTGSLQMTAFIKNAYIKYTKDKFAVSFGLIPTTQFDLQEKLWGYRYVEKSFQDDYKIGSSADLGISATYTFAKWLSADVIVINGEGYKKIQADSTYKAGLGLTLTPVKNLSARVYYDVMAKKVTQSTLVAFLGYNFGKASIGAEYNQQNNFGNSDGKNLSGTSIYATVIPIKAMKVFARYDLLQSNKLSGATSDWNLSSDGSLIIAGLEFQPVKGLKISPNYRLWTPADGSKKPTNSFFLSCDINF